MVTPYDFHKQQTETLNLEVKNLKVRRNILTFLKLIAFVAILIFTTLVFSNYSLVYALLLASSLIGFVVIAVLDEKATALYFLKKELKKASELELAYLNRDFSGLDQGNDFASGKHHFSNDLDLFGSDSLFQALNRTTTGQGRSKLASWILDAKFTSEEILITQKGVNELKELATWRLLFRATGNLKKQDKSKSDFKSWLKTPSFFNKKWLKKV